MTINDAVERVLQRPFTYSDGRTVRCFYCEGLFDEEQKDFAHGKDCPWIMLRVARDAAPETAEEWKNWNADRFCEWCGSKSSGSLTDFIATRLAALGVAPAKTCTWTWKGESRLKHYTTSCGKTAPNWVPGHFCPHCGGTIEEAKEAKNEQT